MFLRKQIKNGTDYYSLVRTYREDGKVKQKAIGVGTTPKIANAISYFFSFPREETSSEKYPSKEEMERRRKLELKRDEYRELVSKEKEKLYKKYPELAEEYAHYKKAKGQGNYCAVYKCIRKGEFKSEIIDSSKLEGWWGYTKEKEYTTRPSWCTEHRDEQEKKAKGKEYRRKREKLEEQKEKAWEESIGRKHFNPFGIIQREAVLPITPEEILGVSKDATQQEIKSRYKQLAKQFHPDRGGDSKMFQLIQQAYKSLVPDK